MYKGSRLIDSKRICDGCIFLRTRENITVSLFEHFDYMEYDFFATTIHLETYKQGIEELKETGACEICNNESSVIIRKRDRGFSIRIHYDNKCIETFCDCESAREKIFSVAD